ncbi:MAG: DUF2178 domain-containing protein [Candidatus Paceibacterota bacterium]
MDIKTYAVLRTIIVILLAAIFSASVAANNYIIPFVVAIAALAVLVTMKKKVQAVMEDERDYFLAGNAARYALSIYCIFGAIASLVLMANRNVNPEFELIGSLVAYSTCGLLILQGLIFKIMKNRNYGSPKDDN